MSDVIKLVAVFLSIVVALKLSGKLPLAIGVGTIVTGVIFNLGFANFFQVGFGALISKMTIETVLAFYTITYLQRMLEKKGSLIQAENALDGLFNNRRVNASLAPAFIGTLPSAGAITICGAMVSEAVGDDLTVEEKAFVTSYYRHIPESFLPTYQSIIIGVELSGIALSSFLVGMVPMVVALFFIGHFLYLRKVPKETGNLPSKNKSEDFKKLIRGLWTIILTIALIMLFKLPVYISVIISIALFILVEKFNAKELLPMIKSAFEARLIISTVIIMVFKDIVAATGAIERMPNILSGLPIPTFLIFIIIFFLGTVISGQQAINVIALPLAFSTISGGGMPLLILLMCTGYSAMQVSPTHICLFIASEYFGVPLGSLIKKTLPAIGIFMVIVTGYYLLLNIFI